MTPSSIAPAWPCLGRGRQGHDSPPPSYSIGDPHRLGEDSGTAIPRGPGMSEDSVPLTTAVALLGVRGGGTRLGVTCAGPFQTAGPGATVMEFVWPKQGLLRCAGFSSLALVLTRPLPVAYARSSCWAPRGPWPKTLQELMAEAGMGDAGHPHRLQSSLEFGVPDNPTIEENSSQEALALLPALPH